MIISIDGLGSHLLSTLSPSDVPAITKLQRDGVEAIRAETVQKAQTVPGHASMLSGVDTLKHGQVQNEMDASLKKIAVPTLFDLAKKNGLRTAAIFGKEKLRFMFDTGALDLNLSPTLWPFGDLWGRLPSVVDRAAIRILRDEKPNLLFVHYALVDTIGHAFQWETSPQKFAVRRVDASIARLTDSLDSVITPPSIAADSYLPPFDRYVILLTADHGGHEGSHGQTNARGELESLETDLVIPWIVYSSKSRPKLVDEKATIKVYDTAATAAALLNLEIPTEWNWDGVNRLAP